MKRNYFSKFIIFAALLLCCAAFLWACGGDDSDTKPTAMPKDADYCVKVVDVFGNPVTDGVVVKFMKDGQQLSMHVIDDKGEVVKHMDRDDYTVELLFTDDESMYYYDKDNTKMTKENTELEIVLASNISGTPYNLSIDTVSYDAYYISAGGTHTSLKANERNYFIFSPTQAGEYKLYTINKIGTIGYYGAPHFVQTNNVAQVNDDGSITINVHSSMIGTQNSGTAEYVIGLDPNENINECIICVERVGDVAHSYEDEPWIIYAKTVALNKYTLQKNVEIKEFDLTSPSSAYNLILNENDGFYHIGSADGPLVLVRLSKDSDYLASFKTILETSGVVKYFFDDNGEYIKKESYSECLLEYINYVDEENGVYPLTADLKYIIQQRGEYVGWFDSDKSTYLFKESDGEPISGINNDISWLFMCCYID